MAKDFGVPFGELEKPIILQHDTPNQHGTLGFSEEGATVSGYAKPAIFPVPKLFYKSSRFYGFNLGASLTAPSGLSMSWGGEAGNFLKDINIAFLEFAPSVSFNLGNRLSVGYSNRILYGFGTFNNVVYVPLSGSVHTHLDDFDDIPEELIPPAMKEMVYAVNSCDPNGQGATSFAGFFAASIKGKIPCPTWNNDLRYNIPTLFNPERWFGATPPSELGDPRNVSEYNKRVQESNRRMKENYQQFLGDMKSGKINWYYINTHNNYAVQRAVQYVETNRICKENEYWAGKCRPMVNPFEEGLYKDCYTGKNTDFSGNIHREHPGLCTWPSPDEIDKDGNPRGYLNAFTAKEVAEIFDMSDIHVQTDLLGSAMVEQRSEGKGFAFGHKFGATLVVFESDNTRTTVSSVYSTPIEFNLKGKVDADTYIGGSIGNVNMKADLKLTTTLPAQWQIALAQTFHGLTIEAVYERVFWKKAKIFDFQFSNPVFSAHDPNSIVAKFSDQRLKAMMDFANFEAVAMGSNWKDTVAYKIGLTYQTEGGSEFMASAAYDESPVPQDQLGIPDSNGYMFGVGLNIPVWESFTLGAAASLTLKDGSNSIYKADSKYGKVLIASAAMGYKF